MGYLRKNTFIFQIFIASIIYFCCSDMLVVLNSICFPSKIQSNTYFTSTVTKQTIFCVFSLISAFIYNIYGRFVLIPAALTYVLLAGSYIASNDTFYIVANALFGIGSSILFVVISSIVVSYPDEKNKGKAFSLYWMISTLGLFISSIIHIAQNQRISFMDPASPGTIIIMVIMAVGSMITFLLLPANKVKRANDSVVSLHKPSNWRRECSKLLNMFKNWRLIILVPLFFSSGWTQTYHLNTFSLYYDIDVHKRLIIILFHWSCYIVGGVCTGLLLDAKFLEDSRKRRGFIVNAFALVLAISLWIGCIVIQNRSNEDSYFYILDLEDEIYSGYIVLYIIFGLLNSIHEGLIYWILGTMTNDTERAARYMGLFYAIQAAASPLANLLPKRLVKLRYQVFIAFVIHVSSLALSLFACRKITNVTVESVDNLIINEKEIIIVGGEIKSNNALEDSTPLKNEV